MTEHESAQIAVPIHDQKVTLDKRTLSTKHGPCGTLHCCYDLFLIFKRFRDKKQHRELIDFLQQNYPANVKNKTFNFINTNHLFHSLYAYIPAINNIERERKQIRLSVDCIQKLFINTINDFKLYSELFDMIRANGMKEECPCQLLTQRRDEIKNYVNMINQKKFDNKPPKLKKETIDNVMYKYSLNWKNLLLKRKLNENLSHNNVVTKKKRKLKNRSILTDEYIYIEGSADMKKLNTINGMSLDTSCHHDWTVAEKQMRAGDEAVSFIRYCKKCSFVNLSGRDNYNTNNN
ncbi:lef5 [Hemileuca sp. nucleopolyhedrovirus]|uniref:Lef5 n=1 Tax=Hemileuca sp. nucleopolyhedrovirus TaxID=1367203 RepID=S5MQF4_9ABAC|nr:lef5 [Hemileuca sp. nucleopolyhedrovirus]AGR56839.1 lef5 [Hemileuca sp. nucleopolyhedrovirus]